MIIWTLRTFWWMMSATARRRRRRVLFAVDQEHTSRVATLVASAAAVIFGTTISRRLLRRRMGTNRGSTWGHRSIIKRTWRSVQDVYNELGNVYFRRAYRMTFDTLTRLATVLCPYIIAASGQSAPKYFVPNGPISPDVPPSLSRHVSWCQRGQQIQEGKFKVLGQLLLPALTTLPALLRPQFYSSATFQHDVTERGSKFTGGKIQKPRVSLYFPPSQPMYGILHRPN
jgi:hypothetical protein